jgi:hypothetical protein
MLLLAGLYLALYQELSAPIGDAFSAAIVEHAHPDFLRWLRWVGTLMAVRGVYVIATAYIRPTKLSSTFIAVGGEALSLLHVPLLLWLRDHANVIPVVSLTDGQMRVRSLQAVGAVRTALNVLIALTLVGVAVSVARIVIGTGSGTGEG